MMINPLSKITCITTLCGLVGSSSIIFGLPAVTQLGTSPKINTPQAILVLGGSPTREKFAAKFARQHPQLPIFVSSGSPEEYAEYVFDQEGIDRDRIHLDYRAVDTVSNFTVMVKELEKRQINNIYLVTSDYHMSRALVIGKIVLGSRGIQIQPVTIPSKFEPESPVKSLRDGLRSVFWLMTTN
ncbi:YdcF family protein [Pseudanabaena sp. FACHB-1277]|jgi:uncharacterized SAM-binding protein YcdF (DUF218 family)|uniref:YdcF family protein n=1 Tax=Pseudanabaena cinerea FACHB-1277 TaxID=2949581 RepID=A0A926UTJ5_9CYAN|nr:YdcF family protein [Pseudanabaena cinerea FACHB-1277]